MLGKTRVRAPFPNSEMYVDGLVGITFPDGPKQPIVDYPSTAEFVREAERKSLDVRRYGQPERLQITMSARAALPISLNIASVSVTAMSVLEGDSINISLGTFSAALNSLGSSGSRVGKLRG